MPASPSTKFSATKSPVGDAIELNAVFLNINIRQIIPGKIQTRPTVQKTFVTQTKTYLLLKSLNSRDFIIPTQTQPIQQSGWDGLGYPLLKRQFNHYLNQ